MHMGVLSRIRIHVNGKQNYVLGQRTDELTTIPAFSHHDLGRFQNLFSPLFVFSFLIITGRQHTLLLLTCLLLGFLPGSQQAETKAGHDMCLCFSHGMDRSVIEEAYGSFFARGVCLHWHILNMQ
jgi:hypothetical protein